MSTPSPIERAEEAFRKIWPDGETCGHKYAREGFAALREAREERDARAKAQEQGRS